MVWRLGYDSRAWPVWILAGWGVLLLAYLTPGDRNVNFVYGYGADAEQLLPPLIWLALVMAVVAVAWALTHWVVLFTWRKFNRPIVP